MKDWQAEATHWRQEAEELRDELRAATSRLSEHHAAMATMQTRLTLLESALRSVGRTAVNYVDIT